MERVIINEEEIKEFVNKNKEKLTKEREERKRKIKALLSNYDYMNWLNKFTKDNNGFYTEYYLYNTLEISKEDLDNVNKFKLLFEGIDKYAYKNYIYPDIDDYQIVYGIKDNVNEIYYKIGLITGQGSYYFCDRVEYTDEMNFIDFNDIMNDRTRDNVKEIETGLNNMSNLIVSLSLKGAPLGAIKEVFDKTIREIELSKEKGKEYKK